MESRASLETIQEFLAQKRIAMVGVSRKDSEFSRILFAELCRRGYDMIPVNPAASEIAGRPCFARLQDIQPPPDAALVMTSPAATDVAVRDCAEAGIRRVWMFSAGNAGAVSEKAVAFCHDKGIQVVPGECPYMFFPKPGFHVLHAWIRKLTGHFPQKAAA